MPSDVHEGFLDLFRAAPVLLAELLEEVGGLPLTAAASVSPAPEELSQRSLELRPDAVWLVSHGAAKWVVVLEVQRGRDARKRRSWPLYEWAARKKHGRPALVVVVAPDARVARWAAKPILTPTGGSFRPLVLSPGTLAPVFDVEEAVRSPLRAVLVAMLNGHAEPALAIEVATVAAEAIQSLPEPEVRLCLDLMGAAMHPRYLDQWEERMSLAGYVWKSPITKRHREEGREEGLEEGREKGLEEGREKGLEEGRDHAVRGLVGQQLEIRFGALPPEVLQRLREAPLEEVERWAHRVVTAERLEDVFDVAVPEAP